MTRVNDIGDSRLTIAELVAQGYTLGDAIEIRAFGLFLEGNRSEPALAYARGEGSARELVESVKPHELSEVAA